MDCRLLFSHPTGNAFARAALVSFFEAGILREFHTSVASYPGNVWDVLGKSRWGKELKRRKFDLRLQHLTVQHPFRELGRMLSARIKYDGLARHETGPFCIDAVYRAQDRMTALRLRKRPQLFTGVYAFEDGAIDTLTVAKEHGLLGLYDLPIGYWRTARMLLKGEFERHPEWRSTLTGFKDSREKLDRKDAELARASKVIVASTFTAGTLKDYPGQPVPHAVVPYGFPAVSSEPERLARGAANRDRRLRLLFVGSLSQRKGIADLFAAVNHLGKAVSLTVIGGKVTDTCPALDRELARHRWIPSLPHDRILAEMRAHDVLVFPSLFEGFGLVISEAMSQGTPVITTERTAGPDFITHAKNGWLIKAGSTESLVQQLEMLITDPESVRAAGVEARLTAAARPWSAYGQELVAAIAETS
jgi:glycosyltransferase involved in cell wall biosynthesis